MDFPLQAFDKDILTGGRAARLIGTDEAGRGPLAGPVVAAAVWLEPGPHPELSSVRDSKELSPRRREALFGLIRSKALGVGMGWASASEIDRGDILRASLSAMRRALARVEAPVEGTLVLVDGNREVPALGLAQKTLVGGDGLSLSVACASIVAKVLRDRWMRVLDSRYPGYAFSRHKGYGTREHLEALGRLGPCPEHRFTFAPVRRCSSSPRAGVAT